MRSCPDVPIFTVAGNRDIGNDVARKVSWTGYETQFMDSFYYFKLGERYYIGRCRFFVILFNVLKGLDTQCYKLDFDYGMKKAAKQDEWLEELFHNLPSDAPKSVVMHTALFIEFPDESKARSNKKSLPSKVSKRLLQDGLLLSRKLKS